MEDMSGCTGSGMTECVEEHMNWNPSIHLEPTHTKEFQEYLVEVMRENTMHFLITVAAVTMTMNLLIHGIVVNINSFLPGMTHQIVTALTIITTHKITCHHMLVNYMASQKIHHKSDEDLEMVATHQAERVLEWEIQHLLVCLHYPLKIFHQFPE